MERATDPAWEGRFRAILEAFSVGDALGMPAEFMTRAEIAKLLVGPSGLVEDFAEPGLSRNHPNLGRARVTDDTEQVLWLLEAFVKTGEVSAELSAATLLDWVEKTEAVEKRYIGPSSMAALEAIRKGADPRGSGREGRTCGGIMRTPAPLLFALARGKDIARSVHEACLPTHGSSTALEAALAYARALEAAITAPPTAEVNGKVRDILGAALAGAAEGRALAAYETCAPSLVARIKHLKLMLPLFRSEGELLDFLGEIYGTGLESVDVAAAVFGIFLHAKGDTWLAIRLGASVGGDTDTIAALAGALSAAFARGHNIPPAVLAEVTNTNDLRFEELCERLFRG
jgi:ADP-ribosylglycohydrolase